MTRRAVVLVPISLFLIATVAGAQELPKPRWRLATTADRPVPAAQPAAATTILSAVPAQKAYVDPQTGELVSQPVLPPEPDVAMQESLRAARGKDRPLLRTPEGYLYIDTSDYQMNATAHVGPDGEVHRNCVGNHGRDGDRSGAQE